MRKCLNCGMEFQDESVRFCDCGGPVVEIDTEQKPNNTVPTIEQPFTQKDNSQDSGTMSTLESVQGNNSTANENQPSEESQDVLSVIENLSKEDILDQDLTDSLSGIDDALELDQENSGVIDEVQTKESDEMFSNAISEIEEAIDDGDLENESLIEHEETEINEEQYFSSKDIIFSQSVRIDGESLEDIFQETFGDESTILFQNDVSNVQQDETRHAEPEVEQAPQPPLEAKNPIEGTIRIRVYKNKKLLYDSIFSCDEIKIGRSATGADVDVNLREYDTERYVSRHHVSIFKYEGKYYLVNKSQKSPVYVNNVRLERDAPVLLNNCDKIILGKKIGIIVTEN
ncbi:FHA domain-containing protein [Fervidobacterium islandicum]|uniref:FHA domain-containing protein n=1 Tax=Fervidobacterium islandicum TaxID=2423 RepID=UPI003A6E881C